MQYNEVESTLNYLKSKNFSGKEIYSRPTCILLKPATYENRYQVFKECYFQNVKLLYFVKYVSMMNKNITVLKVYNFIEPGANVIESLKNQLDIPIKVDMELTELMPLNDVRREIMNQYFREKLQMTNEEIKKARGVYSNIKHRSLRSISEAIDLLINELNFDKTRIIKNGYLLHSRPDNIRAILRDIPKIGDVDIREVMHSRPKILMQSCEQIKACINHVKSFNIPESSIIKCVEILTLSPDTVYSRLTELYKVKEFSVMFSNPRILRLIHYQTKAKTRLEYLKQLKMQCFSLSLLSGTAEMFERYAYLGGDKTRGKEIIEFLSVSLTMPVKEVRRILHFHPHWIQVPVLSIKQTMDYLRYNNFSKDDMIENILILLYPMTRIKPKLDALLEWKLENDESKKISDVEVRTLSKKKILSLCLYFMEAEYHFTGDAVFEINKFDSKHDPALISELPRALSEKKYRFGVRDFKKVAQANLE